MINGQQVALSWRPAHLSRYSTCIQSVDLLTRQLVTFRNQPHILSLLHIFIFYCIHPWINFSLLSHLSYWFSLPLPPVCPPTLLSSSLSLFYIPPFSPPDSSQSIPVPSPPCLLPRLFLSLLLCRRAICVALGARYAEGGEKEEGRHGGWEVSELCIIMESCLKADFGPALKWRIYLHLFTQPNFRSGRCTSTQPISIPVKYF